MNKIDLWQNTPKPLKEVHNTNIYNKKHKYRELMLKIRVRFVCKVI